MQKINLKSILLILVGLCTLYLFLTIFIYTIQRNIIYRPDTTKYTPAQWQIYDMQEITLHTQDNLSLTSWYKPAAPYHATIMYFPGNAGNIAQRARLTRPYMDNGYGILLVGYRGYDGNTGSPSEHGLYLDTEAAYHFLRSKNIFDNYIVIYGEPLGTGPAVQLASQHQFAAIVLQSPISSLVDLGKYHYPYLPVSWLLKDKFDSLSKIKAIKSSLLFLVTKNDSIVPVYFSEKLFAISNQPKQIIVYPTLSHNSLGYYV